MDKSRNDSSARCDRTARHYGRAYQCLRCLYKDNIVKIDVKKRIEAHITKYHLSLDQVGFYCRLCHFRCWDADTLKNHTGFYARHRRMVRERGGEDIDFLASNEHPYVIGPADYSVLSKEESLRFYQGRGNQCRGQRGSATEPPEPVVEPSQTEPDLVDLWLRDLERDLGDETATPGPLPQAPEQTTTDLVTPSLSTVQEPPAAAPLDLSRPRVENILDQLLGGPMEPLTPFTEPSAEHISIQAGSTQTREEKSPTKTAMLEPPRKRARTRSCSPAPTASSSSSDSSTSSSITPEQWQELGRKIVDPLIRAVEFNTEAIKALKTQMDCISESVVTIGRSCRAIRDVMERQSRQDHREREYQSRRTTQRDTRRH